MESRVPRRSNKAILHTNKITVSMLVWITVELQITQLTTYKFNSHTYKC